MADKKAAERPGEEYRQTNNPSSGIPDLFPPGPVNMYFPSKYKITKIIQVHAHGVIEHMMKMTIFSANERFAFPQLSQKLRPVGRLASRKTSTNAQQGMG